MNFNEKLMQLRKSRGLSQEELAQQIGVSRQTVSKWESAQSYPDFQRLTLLSDYFALSLDVLAKDMDLQEVRDKGLDERQIPAVYAEIQTAKSAVHTVVNALAVIGAAGVAVCLLLGLLLG